MKINRTVPFSFWLMPFPLKFMKKEYGRRAINYLDVGCGNNSPSRTKKWFPQWNYYGVDREDYNIDDRDKEAMAGYYKLDLSKDALSEIPGAYFDVIVLSHVVEHLHNGLDVIKELTTKLKEGGKFYIEFPSERSLALQSKKGTLNFCDDLTHVRLYSIQEIVNLLLLNGFRIIRAGARRDRLRMLLFPVLMPIKWILRGELRGADFWDILGFASYVYAEKRKGAA